MKKEEELLLLVGLSAALLGIPIFLATRKPEIPPEMPRATLELKIGEAKT